MLMRVAAYPIPREPFSVGCRVRGIGSSIACRCARGSGPRRRVHMPPRNVITLVHGNLKQTQVLVSPDAAAVALTAGHFTARA